MVPESHQILIADPTPTSPSTGLTQTFSDFVEASARLELSYRELQTRVAELTLTLSERNHVHRDYVEANCLYQQLRPLVQILPCGVLVIDENGLVTLVNAEAARLLALSAAEVPDLNSIQRRTGMDLRTVETEPIGTSPVTSIRHIPFVTSAGRHHVAVKRMTLATSMTTRVTVVILEDQTAASPLKRQGRFDDSFLGERTQNVERTDLSLEEVERRHMRHVLEQVQGNRTRAAEVLRISVRTLSNKIKQYDLPPRKYA